MDLPEITEVQRIRLNPGDALAICTNVEFLTEQQAEDIKRRVRETLGRPDLPVLILPSGWTAAVAEPAGPGGSA